MYLSNILTHTTRVKCVCVNAPRAMFCTGLFIF